MPRKRVNTFSLSFLDCICCGLGAIILLFVVVNARSAVRRNAVTTDLRAAVMRLETMLIQDRAGLVEARNALADASAQISATQGLSQRIREQIEAQTIEMADQNKMTLATREHANRLKADIRTLDEELRRLKAAASRADPEGRHLLTFPGEGDRHYLTGLKMGGQRILILADASASMLGEAIVDIIRWRNLEDREKLRSGKWRRAVAVITWLTARLPAGCRFQIYTFDETARPLLADRQAAWLDAGDAQIRQQVVEGMRRVIPGSGTSLLNAFGIVAGLQPPPDNIFLITDGLPTMGATRPWTKRVSSQKRRKLFTEAVAQLPPGIPVNTILLPMEGDPLAAEAYWRLAKQTSGSLLCPSEDWP